MRTGGWKFLAILGTALGLGLNCLASAHDGHDHAAASHGGIEAQTKRHHFEVVFRKTGLSLFAHRADHAALDPSRLSATATFYHPSSPYP